MANEYIRREDAVNIAESYEVKIDGFCLDDYEYGRDQVANSIANDLEDIPAADVVPVVRCKDCKFRENDDFCTGRGFPCQLVPDDGFCDKGERKERA